MASRAESGGWSYSGSGSIWQGNNPPLVRGSFDHDDTTWRAWQSGIDRNHNFKRADPPLPSTSSPLQPLDSDSNTLCMGNLEPWMDHEYASQVVRLMGWDRTATAGGSQTTQNSAVTIKIPPPPPDTIPQPNNPGYCLITFPSAAQAASVLASLNSGNNKDPASAPLLMPNSSRPFNLQWANASQFPPASAGAAFGGSVHNAAVFNGLTVHSVPAASTTQGSQREFSIFVGDLAPETSNSDLVAVFRNPVLGLRNDREPKFIRPFYSCKSAKIMLDPVTGVSRGYGFVRFTDEADQQRALIEMHGLYCLSRPMRVSPATAKFKPSPTTSIPPQPTPVPLNLATQVPTPEAIDAAGSGGISNGRAANLVTSVSSPVAAASSAVSSATGTTSTINSAPSNTSSTSTSAPANVKRSVSSTNGSSPSPRHSGTSAPERHTHSDLQIAPQILAQIAQLASNSTTSQEWNAAQMNQQTSAAAGIGSFPSSSSMSSQPPPYSGQSTILGAAGGGTGANSGGGALSVGTGAYDEAWTHQAQARAILGNLIGPNGEQLTSTDPYNTTVFVGGLSPLISEETLRTFFAPFGDIHYVKVPLGKHCGFVQFVRKADAERAIERMQGFPIGGSRIRLSWGRSQYKAAQAAAQAAQAAQAEQVARFTAAAAAAVNAQNPASLHITPDQALQLLQSIGYNPASAASSLPSEEAPGFSASQAYHNSNARPGSALNASDHHEFTNTFMPSEHPQRSAFSPFSPAANTFAGVDEQQRQYPIMTPSPSQPLPHPSRSYAPGFGPSPSSVSGKYSDTHSPHSSSTESSSGSSSVRFSGIGNSSGFPNAAFLENPSGSFQVNDILRHDSQTLHPRIPSTSSHPQDSSARTTPPRHQQRPGHNGLHLRDNTSGSEFMHDLNGTLASLDLGERYSRVAIGSEMLLKDGYGHTGERPLSKSISAPLKGLVNPRPKSGDSPDST